MPELGQPTVRAVIEPPYRIVYRVRADLLEVVAVVHSARQFPADQLPWPGRGPPAPPNAQ